MIKFTFDIDKVLEKLNFDYRFSETYLVDFNQKQLITQKQLYSSLVTLYENDIEKIENAYNKGFCTPCSFYNAFPFVFQNKLSNLTKHVYKSLNNDNYANIKYNVKQLNSNNNNNNLFHLVTNLENAYKVFIDNLKNNKPVLATYQYANTISRYAKFQHAIALFGVDDNNIYYFENSDDNILFKSLACYIRDYFANFGTKNKLIKKYLCRNLDENQLLKLASTILGYRKLENGLSILNKNFLTDTNIFYDANQIVECTKTIETKNFTNIMPEFNLTNAGQKLKTIKEKLKEN